MATAKLSKLKKLQREEQRLIKRLIKLKKEIEILDNNEEKA